jgi:ADP-ribose pyrophosphatase
VAPVELDFAKVENDLKFVMSKDFDVDDLPRLRRFEAFLLDHRIPPDVDGLPSDLKFAKWDLRFRKILGAVRRVRTACFSLKDEGGWLVYQMALLRYALHTLSFDRRRERGECELPQLALAAHSVEALLLALIADDFHLKIRGDRPAGYPPRQRISIDEAHWLMECETYNPPVYVDASVLAADCLTNDDGWADPEDVSLVTERAGIESAKFRSDDGLPQNPRGRTGIAGRGLLGRWGPNRAVSGVVVRRSADGQGVEFLAGRYEGEDLLRLPKGLVGPDESELRAIRRVLETKAGLLVRDEGPEKLASGYAYDHRQTDNAWVDLCSFLIVLPDAEQGAPVAGGRFEELKFHALEADAVNGLNAAHAEQVRLALPRLVELGYLAQGRADEIIVATG